MAFPIKPPVKPQLALSRKVLPEGEGWAYEPKYDGFRAIAFVDGEKVYLQSRGAKPLLRYFPEISFPKGRYVLDGEIVPDNDSFNTLGQRIHPAESRIARLAEETPTHFVAFDLLAFEDDVVMDLPFEQRRALLLAALGGRTAREIGEIEAIPVGTAKTRIRSGLLRVRDTLAEDEVPRG